MRVGDEYRTNPLSLTPGGYIVTVHLKSGKTLEYDKVKRPSSYVRVIENKEGAITRIDVNNQTVWSLGDSDKYKTLDRFR